MSPPQILESPRAEPDWEAADELSEWAVSSFCQSATRNPPTRSFSNPAKPQCQTTAQIAVGLE